METGLAVASQTSRALKPTKSWEQAAINELGSCLGHGLDGAPDGPIKSTPGP